MKAGQRNRRITIQRRTQVQDETGQMVDSWVDVAKLWAWVKTQSGMAVASQSGTEGGVSRSVNGYSFRINYRPTLTDDMRVIYQGLYFDIKQLQHDLAGHEWTDIVCQQGGNDG